MFKKLEEKMKRMVSDHVSFDPSSIDDPVAMQTEWTPAKGGGANFRTHKLVTVSANRMEFRASIGAKLFYLIFLLAGMGILIGGSFSKFSSEAPSFDMETFIFLFLGLVFVSVGGSMLYFGTAPIVFDKRKGFFWKGRKAPDQVLNKSSLKHFAHLEQIHALQLVSEYCRGNKSSYYSYELNLVLGNGQRINVVDHGNQNKLRGDATSLSSFLEKPIWDVI